MGLVYFQTSGFYSFKGLPKVLFSGKDTVIVEGYCWGAVRGFRIPNIVPFDNELRGCRWDWNLSPFSLGNWI